MIEFTELFVNVDDFWKQFEPAYEQRSVAGPRHRRRSTRLCLSEMVTILIAFQTSHYRTFKSYYLFLLNHHRNDFPALVSYTRFIQLMPRAALPLLAYLMNRGIDRVTGISFVDSTALAVCSTKRISRNRVFDGWAAMGKTTMGWFFGFKLHLIVNHCGGLLAFDLTPGNVDDRTPVPKMAKGLWGKLFGDKGYIKQELFENLWQQGLKLVTGVRKNMKNKLIPLQDKLLLRKRSIIETINDHLKNVCQVEHTRHRSPFNFIIHLLAGLAAYANLSRKPAIKFDVDIDDDLQKNDAQLAA